MFIAGDTCCQPPFMPIPIDTGIKVHNTLPIANVHRLSFCRNNNDDNMMHEKILDCDLLRAVSSVLHFPRNS